VGRGRQGRREGRAWVGTGGMGMGKEGKAGWEEGRRAPKFISAYTLLKMYQSHYYPVASLVL